MRGDLPTESPTPQAPERYHDANHDPVPFADCWRCQRARAICRSKRTYETREEADAAVREVNETREEADAAVREVNETEGYRRPVVRYRCRWCLAWHLTTARGKHERRRAEKQRRRWLVATVTSAAKRPGEAGSQIGSKEDNSNV